MKKISILLMAFMAVLNSYAQLQQVPNGLYIRTQVIAENGTVVPVKDQQFRFFNDDSMISLELSWWGKNEKSANYYISNEEKPPHSSTLTGSDVMNEQVFDITNNSYRLKYFLTSNYEQFPKYSWATEVWERTKLSTKAKQLLKRLSTIDSKGKYRLNGVWKNDKTYWTYKVYTKDAVYRFSYEDGKKLSGDVKPAAYPNDNAVQEGDGLCKIEWLTHDSYKLTWTGQSGETYDEIWTRSELPSSLSAFVMSIR